MHFAEQECYRALKLRPKLTGSQWADLKRQVAPGTSPEPGEWRTSRVPYLREPMDAMTDRTTETVVLMWASQLGKSELLLNVLGFYVDQDPSPVLMVQPTLETAENFSKQRIDPTFRYTPAIAEKLEDGKDGRGTSRKSSTTIRTKMFPGGYLMLMGANSPAGLASNPIRILLCDEIDRYKPTKEGDPLELATQRTQNFYNRKKCYVSTPTIKGASNIEKKYLESDQRQYYIPCPHCGHEHVWKWEYVKWDKDENGEVLPLTARIVCPECGETERGAYKPNPEILNKGYWIPTNKSSRIKGYHLNALYSPWTDLFELVEKFVKVTRTRDKAGLMEFVNLKLGEVWDENQGEQDIWEYLHRRREYYVDTNTLPEKVLILTAGVDVQDDRLECTVYGWGEDKECWGIEHRVMYGSPLMPDVWQQLDGFLQKQRPLPNGTLLRIACTCVDSGNGNTAAYVYRYTKPREHLGIYSVKGRGGFDVPLVNKPTKSNTEGAFLFSLGVDSGKSIVMRNLRIEDEGAGYVHYPRQAECGFNENFFQQLTAERLELKYEKGVMKRSWYQFRDRNEALDCMVYATAALEIVNPNFEFLKNLYENGGGSTQQTQTQGRRRRGVVSRGVTL